jgi:tRNA pseudouridine38-40 synthase
MSEDRKYRLVMNLSYDGASFYGWQRQSNHEPTVQGVLEEKISQLMNKKVSVVASGRTDRGAHALSQWAHVDIPKNPLNMNLLYKLNRLTPDTLRINSLYLGSRAFHAQQSSTQKKYIYKIHNGPVAHPFKLHYFFHVRQPLDLNLLNKLASYLIKTQDFKSFQSVGTDVENTVRTIFECHWTKNHDDLTFHIVGDGFLKQMVRNIVGTMVWCAQQKDGEAQFVNIIDSLDRRKAKVPAPAHGLFLKWVRYPQKLLTSLQKLEN